MKDSVKKMVQRSQDEKGQSIVELLFTVPIFLILFAVSYQMFNISWNAQYVTVRARHERMNTVKHAPCGKGASGVSFSNGGKKLEMSMNILGGAKLEMDSQAVIVCQ